MNDSLRYVLKNILNRKLRSYLTIIGIVIGIAAIVALMTIGQGMENAIQEQFEKLGISQIRVVPGSLRGPPNPDTALRQSDADLLRGIKGVDYINPILIEYADVAYNHENQYLNIMAEDTSVSKKSFADTDVKVIEGRMFEPSDKYSAILGFKVANETFKKRIHAKNSIAINGVKFKVIGIFENTGTEIDKRVYIPISIAREMFNKPDVANIIIVAVLPGIDINEMIKEIKRKLEKEHDDTEFQVLTPAKILERINQMLGVIQAVLAGIAAISLLVGAVGIMNSMYTSVLERTKEIGIMKAIGARRSRILRIFLIESGLIGLIGGIIGVIFGLAIAFSVEGIASLYGFELLKIRAEPGIIIFALLFAFILGMISGILPALRAARLKPVDALRYE
ncbi:ABC transporter permease [Candidatus Woesearchaeota archaeon]|nr:MAG: ABC transporter permease [Candidatus Woesearchaeota archaeon]